MNAIGRESKEQEHPAPRRTPDHGAAQIQGVAQLLETLDAGVMVLSRDLCITYANARWQNWLETPISLGAPIASLLEENAALVLTELRGALADSQPRDLQLILRAPRADAMTRRLRCSARRSGDGLVLEAHAEGDDERWALHDVARRLAEVTDMAEVLRTLCDISTQQCDASGAAVLRVLGQQGEVVAAAGDLLPARGRCFELQGSLLAQALAEQMIVSEEDYHVSGRPLMREVPELAVGPMLVAPLQAHGEMLGVLAVARGVGAGVFHAREFERLRMLADHAALAVHKSLLLMQAQSADRAKGRFLATMSHELRTPLTALAGYNELLCDQVIGPMSDPQLDILERMRSVTMHLSAMIEEILAFTSLE